ncbi:MAG: DNA polymerase IV [Erysipelotrichaceae bacterium]|nr:DNA polymerase IV [Erysipelotrichaceae bacterium]
MPVIVHIDMNCFFASCEVKKDPSLKGKKIIIGGTSSRSIVSAASYEAKKDGIYTTMPIYMAKEKCKDAIFLPVDYSYYEKVSSEIFTFLKNRFPILEIASIDEAYIDMSDIYLGKDPVKYFYDLQKEIYETLHIPCSIGVSYCKFLAKMGSDYKKPLGITIIKKKDIEKIIYPLPIDATYGIGKATSAKLKEINILTIKDLVTSNDVKVREILGSYYQTIISLCKGEVAERIHLQEYNVKSIGNSHTLDYNTDDYQVIKENLKYLCDEVTLRLKANSMLAYTITLTIKDKNFVSKSKSKQIIEPTDDNDKVFIEILKLLDKFESKVIRLVGVSVSKLIYKNQYYKQLSLFSKDEIAHDTTSEIIYKLNQIVGKNVFIKAKDAIKNDKRN